MRKLLIMIVWVVLATACDNVEKPDTQDTEVSEFCEVETVYLNGMGVYILPWIMDEMNLEPGQTITESQMDTIIYLFVETLKE